MAIHKKIKRQHLTCVVSENLQYFIVMEAFPKGKEKKKNLDVPALVLQRLAAAFDVAVPM